MIKTVSERNLYNLIKERFPDAEFQKTFNWVHFSDINF